jgi:hypothetical protein
MDGETKKKPNTLPVWGNERTMNLNTMILTNIQASPYFKNQLYEFKTYHAVVDEIYYKVRAVVGRRLNLVSEMLTCDLQKLVNIPFTGERNLYKGRRELFWPNDRWFQAGTLEMYQKYEQ